jgi:hypothetical protein
MTQSDPGGIYINIEKRKENIDDIYFTLGSLPAWFMNKVSKVLVPKVR